MNEAEYVFAKDVQEKKRIGRGARNKVNGMNSKKCTLPSDSMSRKEFQSMHGDVHSWKLSEFYSWDEFKQMPPDIQVEYVNRMSGKYSVGLSTLSLVLFNLSDDQALRKYLRSHDLLDRVSVKSVRGASKGRCELIEDLRKAQMVEVPSTVALADDAAQSTYHIGTEIQGSSHPMKSMTVMMDGFDDGVLAFLRSQCEGRNVEVQISVRIIE